MTQRFQRELINLPDLELQEICVSDRQAQLICENDSFWKMRFQRFYPEFVFAYNGKRTWREFYSAVHSLMNMTVDKNIANHYLGQSDMLKVLAFMNFYPVRHLTGPSSTPKDGGKMHECKTCTHETKQLVKKDGGYKFECTSCGMMPSPNVVCKHEEKQLVKTDGGYKFECKSCGMTPQDGGSNGAGLGLGLIAGLGIGAAIGSSSGYERGRRDASY